MAAHVIDRSPSPFTGPRNTQRLQAHERRRILHEALRPHHRQSANERVVITQSEVIRGVVPSPSGIERQQDELTKSGRSVHSERFAERLDGLGGRPRGLAVQPDERLQSARCTCSRDAVFIAKAPDE